MVIKLESYDNKKYKFIGNVNEIIDLFILQIQYIFSDKTGTLTENKMIFRRCAIGAIDYNHTEMPDESVSYYDTIIV